MNEFKTNEAKASYGIGLQMGQQLAESGLIGLDLSALTAGIQTALNAEQPLIDVSEINDALKAVYEIAEKQRLQAADDAKIDGETFLAKNATRDEVTVLESGLQYEVITTGSGKIPAEDSLVSVHYHGELINGTVFDSSILRGQPAQFPVNGVIKGWVEALQKMPVGSKWKLYIPQHLAYGEHGAGAAIPAFAALIFEVELLEIL